MAIEDEALEARVAARTADLEAFAALAAHELQEPVRKIQMFGDLIKPGSGVTPAEMAEYVERMQDAARRMGLLVQDMLSLARARNVSRPLESVSLGPVAREAADEYASNGALDGGTLELGPLPTLQGDPGQLRQLFGNLFSNAVKFRRKGVPVRISVACKTTRPGFVDIEVSDNGIGFEQQHSGRIFEPFQRLHRRTDYEGSGLGLALCARIAARHGGLVSARSVPGEGSIFIVSLPTGNGG